jgi:dihydrofolate reductase
MGRVVVSEFITVDGVMEDPGGGETFDRGGWAFRFDQGPEGAKFKFAELMAADALLLGRITYEGFAKAWPTMEGTGEFGEVMNSIPKLVVSSTLESPSWNNSSVISADLASEVAKLAERYDRDILVAGSARLVQRLLALDLVDELRLMVFPVVLGKGKRLFADGAADQTALKVAETGQSADVAMLVFRRER